MYSCVLDIKEKFYIYILIMTTYISNATSRICFAFEKVMMDENDTYKFENIFINLNNVSLVPAYAFKQIL